MSNTIKVQDIRHAYISGDKVTMFTIYKLVDNIWIYDCTQYIYGWYKRESTILKKYIEFNNQ